MLFNHLALFLFLPAGFSAEIFYNSAQNKCGYWVPTLLKGFTCTRPSSKTSKIIEGRSSDNTFRYFVNSLLILLNSKEIFLKLPKANLLFRSNLVI